MLICDFHLTISSHDICNETRRKQQARKLRKYKERRLGGYHGGLNMGENLADVLNSIEDVEDEPEDDAQFIDPEQAVVTKVKK